MTFLAKIAVELENAVALRVARGAGSVPPDSRILARGAGWSAEDLVCTCGRHDHPFQERHTEFSVAFVLAGTFQYRAAMGTDRAGQLMMPGSVLLGNPGQSFECGHEHGQGDRCLSFHFAPEFLEGIAADTGLKRSERIFRSLRLPATREMSPLIARGCAELAGSQNMQLPTLAWEELALQVGASAMRLANAAGTPMSDPLPSTLARITRAIRMMEENHESKLTLQHLASEAGLSPYHFLRTFEQVTGMTPHQCLRRMRLRRAAVELLADRRNVLEIVFDCGFGDVSNFNRAFRGEFGLSPKEFRRQSLSLEAHAPSRVW